MLVIDRVFKIGVNLDMATTLQDIAKVCGVSKMTVSIVLNNGRDVGPETRARVLKAMRELNYRPNGVARGFSRRRMDTIGIILSETCNSPILNPWAGPIIDGVVTVATERGKITAIITARSWREAQEKMPIYCDGRCDGLILAAPDKGLRFSSVLNGYEVPFILVNDGHMDPEATSIDIDNISATKEAMEYLISLGHHRIAFIGWPEYYTDNALRLIGYKEALKAAGIGFRKDMVLCDTYLNYEWFRELIHRPKRPTAFFCSSDELAIAVIEECQKNNLAIPRDASVVGFDDTLAAKYNHPTLTSIRQPLIEMGKMAAEMLLQQIETKDLKPQKIMVPTELIIRESTGLCPKS